MNKRSFFKSLALLTAGAVIAPPGLFIPKLEPVKWKASRGKLAVVNPDWVTAKYEVYFITNPSVYDSKIIRSEGYYVANRIEPPPNMNFPYPVRGNELDKHGFPVSIPPFILV